MGKNIAEMAEWSIATDCKSVALTGYPGSNPGLSTYEKNNYRKIDRARATFDGGYFSCLYRLANTS